MTEAQLDLTFAVRGGRTVLAHRHVSYPFHVTAPLRDAGPDARVIVQSVSGGFFGGEVLGHAIAVGAGACATIRMPSAAVVHARDAKDAPRQSVSLRAEAGARLSYLPRPVILFPGGALVQTMDVTVGRGATVIMRDGFMMHDPEKMAPLARRLDGRVTVRSDDGRIIALDRMRVTDEIVEQGRPGVTGGYRAFGTVWVVREMDRAACDALAIADHDGCYVAVTALREGRGAMVRVAAQDGGDLDTAMERIERVVRLITP